MIDGDLYVIQKLIYQMQLMSYGLQTFLQTNSANCSANHLYRLGIAAVKESIQMQNGKEVVIAYAGRSLNSAELSYLATEKQT